VKVVEAALSLGYSFRKSAATPSENHLSVIGMLIKHDFGAPIETNPFYSQVQLGIEYECRKRDINLMYANIDVDQRNRPMEWPIMLREKQLDGLVLMGMMLDETVERIQKLCNVPVVLIDSYAPALPFDQVVTDNVKGAKMALEHLVALGHKAIGLIGWNPESPVSIQERRTGYVETLLSHGLKPGYIEESMMNRVHAASAVKNLLHRCPEVTAIFGCNDETAIGTILGAREMGLRVPDDLSIVGFDNINVAKDITPALTTVNVSKYWMGSIGVRMLLNRVENPDQPRVTTVLSTNMVLRSSVAPPKQETSEVAVQMGSI
jgi:LacI family transcriptional regulator